MAKIAVEWKAFRTSIDATDGRSEMKAWIRDLKNEINDKTVYVIRTARPFSIAYKDKASPVLYIGEGNLSQRVGDHLKKWIADLGTYLPTLEIEVRYSRISVRGRTDVHKDVEADLLWKFGELYGTTPLFNRQYEYHNHEHTYEAGFYKILNPGSGRGYHWALRPLASNSSYPRSLKGSFV